MFFPVLFFRILLAPEYKKKNVLPEYKSEKMSRWIVEENGEEILNERTEGRGPMAKWFSVLSNRLSVFGRNTKNQKQIPNSSVDGQVTFKI